ncbi:hypothetical protein MMC18_007921 [Xylographa bjoerkii]|nr:hypothetical protein [Xylographa bjoerkii]
MALNLTTSTMGDDSPMPSPPFTRGSSPSPSVSPTPALLSCPQLDRCFSTTSTISTFSGRSSSSGSAPSRRRGYARPQGVAFAESAKNRDSVMSLGSIAHLQYYFARTGILDGKGGQMAKDTRKDSTTLGFTTIDLSQHTRLPQFIENENDFSITPSEADDTFDDWDSSLMLPPTVSTYSHRTHYIPPPPDAATLRKDLEDELARVTRTVAEVRAHKERNLLQGGGESPKEQDQVEDRKNDEQDSDASQGWHQLEGMNMLDVVTLAIRSAKIYYTMHEQPQRLTIIKSERQVREELLNVLDVLKRMVIRNFAYGIKEEELQTISGWVEGVEEFLAKEQVIAEREAGDQEKWQWLEGAWEAGDRRREWLFMSTFADKDALPEWTAPSNTETQPTLFLAALRNGLTLVNLHNRILKKSKRQFGEIRTFHTDTAKPYRIADNLRYWIKAAEIRWETKLQVDVMGVVYGKGDDVWKDFDSAILAWCCAVREEITKEWKQGSVQVVSLVPSL